MNKCTRNGGTWCVLGEIYPSFMVQIVCGLLALIKPTPPCRDFNCLNWLGGGIEWEVKREDCQGGGGKVKGQLSLRPVGTLVVGERIRKAPAVQSGRALPMGSNLQAEALHFGTLRLNLCRRHTF